VKFTRTPGHQTLHDRDRHTMHIYNVYVLIYIYIYILVRVRAIKLLQPQIYMFLVSQTPFFFKFKLHIFFNLCIHTYVPIRGCKHGASRYLAIDEIECERRACKDQHENMKYFLATFLKLRPMPGLLCRAVCQSGGQAWINMHDGAGNDTPLAHHKCTTHPQMEKPKGRA